MKNSRNQATIPSPRGAAAAFVDGLHQRGRYVFTRDEAIRALGQAAPTVRAGLRLLERKRRILKVSDRRGFFVIVPNEYTTAGAPPATWYIDALMAHLRQPYYIGLLSAAEMHGAAHQAPQVFQIVTSKPVRPLKIGRQRIVFVVNQRINALPIERMTVQTGYVRVSTVVTTALDLVRYFNQGGGLNNVATILRELTSRIRAGDLRKTLDVYDHLPSAQRLGYILEQLGHRQLATPIAQWLAKQKYGRRLLDPRSPANGANATEPWRVVGNVILEPDV